MGNDKDIKIETDEDVGLDEFGAILGFIIMFLQLQVNRFKRYCILQEFLYIIN
jgi:hypothetical protein